MIPLIAFCRVFPSLGHLEILLLCCGAISILFGPGGAGKSFYQLRIIIRELRDSRRNIVTNLAINIPEFNAYLERHYPNEDIDLISRLRIIADSEVREFWKFRGPLIRTFRPVPDAEQVALGRVGYLADYVETEDRGANGVAYIIDEAGINGFSAQGWAQRENGSVRGVEAAWYLDQQRKFGDNVYASLNGTNPHGIAKPFRDKAHDFTQLRNGRLRQMGLFRARGLFTAWHYYVEPGPNVEFYAKEDFPLDLELAACYRTGDGVGIVGGKADLGARVKGIPILWVFPLALALGSLIFLGPWLLGKVVSKGIVKGQKQATVAVDSAMGAITGRGVKASDVRDNSLSMTVSGYTELTQGNPSHRWYELVMSDGSHISSDDEPIEKLSGNRFVVGTSVYRFVRKVVAGFEDGGKDSSKSENPALGLLHHAEGK